ncbi:hypothetical protein Q3G72_015764 [Acer saccharum]|nr:hypothetical protein Q3G72_015764 [Acer saccharum]
MSLGATFKLVNAVTSSMFKQQHHNRFSIFRRNWLLYGDDFREPSSCWDCANELVSYLWGTLDEGGAKRASTNSIKA